VDADAAVAPGAVEVVQPLAPPGDGPLAAIQRADGGVLEGGVEFLG
jgi:hypothetical protein